ncbi:hypothetical protein F5146DRAFT_1028967 [Armillaria mellea]|nr:hypothetical protein F5146DRAFT_1028967 [Armillaria mellea]
MGQDYLAHSPSSIKDSLFLSLALAPPRLPLSLVDGYHGQEIEAATLEVVLGAFRANGGAETEGEAGLTSLSPTPMGRPMVYYCIYRWWVHHDRRDGAGLRRPPSSAGNPWSLRVRGMGLGACNARICFVPSTPSYRYDVGLRGGCQATTSCIR